MGKLTNTVMPLALANAELEALIATARNEQTTTTTRSSLKQRDPKAWRKKQLQKQARKKNRHKNH